MLDIPQGETWQTLKKGGTSGIYVVIMGLSWLIEAEQSEHAKHDETDTWTLVEDNFLGNTADEERNGN